MALNIFYYFSKIMNTLYTSKFIFFGVFTVLCSWFPFTSLLAAPGVCSSSFEGLIKQTNGGINLILVCAVILIGLYLFFSGVGLINLSGCLLRLGMPSDYPNAVMRAFMYSQFRSDSNYSKSEIREANVHLTVNSIYSSSNANRSVESKQNTDGYYNNHILTLDGEFKKRLKRAMQTAKARLILAIVSVMVVICVSYASFAVFEGSQIFLEPNSIILNHNGVDLLGPESKFGNTCLLLIITAISIVILNMNKCGSFILCIVSCIHFFGLLLFFTLYFINFPNEAGLSFISFESESIQFDWDVHIWGFVGGILEMGAFVISAVSFHIILPGAFKLFPDYEVKSSRIWRITISLILFIFFCGISIILGTVPSFPILPYGLEPSSEGIGLAWRILESKISSNSFFSIKLLKRVFLLGNFITWILFVSVVMKCIDNIVRSISNQVECNFESFSPNKNSLSKRYFLRSAKQQIYGNETNNTGGTYEYLSNDKIEANRVFFWTVFKNLKALVNRNRILDFARYSASSASAIGIIFFVHHKLISEPYLIPIFRSLSASIFSIIVLILPCAIFWFVFYSEMVPQSSSNYQILNLIFLGRVSSRIDRSYEKHRDKLSIYNDNCNFSCNPLTFGFFSITFPIILGCTILVYEISKFASLCLGLRFNS
ncbi:hypothetical protein [Cryptosporidium parvum Iowa II]|uniref:Uncharacterized protein n=2 Tax=Cryptosporidium parvum TaxID=5807 RepID=Q5CTK4_CRYPI|nr:hypothetical protein [Cryptosporidium parvum Iowa II]EAK88739.1 hypothetical protein, signal peptide plus 11 transmembrane domains [Cryptosporidium parvum Iowa II]QOY42968.1 Uncharacterized protein CPATCC_0028160 [Cryptosporidium parvum]WRK31053.1 Uncharacterized protein cpbgf_2002630 [Cryptosporidium parvum]|eukprot:QOY42968.1 hypothetical protein CPATCC_000662 [Cryptosporidium parvum]